MSPASKDFGLMNATTLFSTPCKVHHKNTYNKFCFSLSNIVTTQTGKIFIWKQRLKYFYKQEKLFKFVGLFLYPSQRPSLWSFSLSYEIQKIQLYWCTLEVCGNNLAKYKVASEDSLSIAADGYINVTFTYLISREEVKKKVT